MDDLDLSLALSPDPEPAAGQAPEGAPAGEGEGKSAIEPAATKESTDGDGTAVPGPQEGEPGAEQAKGVFPKELEPYKSLFDSRKWDPSKPDGIAALAKAYQEVESFSQQSRTLHKNSQDKAQRLEALASGTAEDINKFRQSRGLPPIAVDTRTVEQREKEHSELLENVKGALKGDPKSTEWLEDYFGKQREEVLLAKLEAKQAKPSKTAEEAFKERKTLASTHFAEAVRKNPEAKVFADELSSYFDAGGAFDSLGIDVLDAFGSPERAAAFVELGQALNVYRNLEKVVEGKVSAELERRRTAGNAAGPGNKGPKGSAPKKESEAVFDPTTIFR